MITKIAPPPAEAVELLTRQEVARRLSVHPATVRRMEKAGKLRAVILGGQTVRYHASDLIALVVSSSVATAQG